MVSESDRLRFKTLVLKCASLGRDDFGIGTYKEKSLHYILKNFFESDTDYHEVAFRGYVADIKNDSGITEIQTSSLYGMNGKLKAFLPEAPVRIVRPLSRKRNLVWIDPATGNMKRSTRSTSADNPYGLLAELIYIADHIAVAGLTVTAVFVDTDDYRLLDGYGRDRKIRATKVDRVPTELVDVVDYVFPRDVVKFMPEGLPDRFTRDDFSKATKLRGRDLWAALKVLTIAGLIREDGKSGRKICYAKG